MHTVLETLDEVDWSSLRQAYGSAEKIPGLLRAAANDEDAVDELFGTLCHQGSTYPASVAAIPFLLELIEARTAQREMLSWLLALIASGAEERVAAHAALKRHLERMVTLLDDGVLKVRQAGILMLCHFSDQPKVGAALRASLERERDEVTRAAIGLALERAGARVDDAFNEELSVLAGADAERVPALIEVLMLDGLEAAIELLEDEEH